MDQEALLTRWAGPARPARGAGLRRAARPDRAADADPRPDKIDVGVGVYRDAAGNTPILRCVKAAERHPAGDARRPSPISARRATSRFTELIKPIVFGEAAAADDRIVGVQTPGGCGALRLGAELIARANPEARIFVGQPTWPNHAPADRLRRRRDGRLSLLFDRTAGRSCSTG